MLQLILGKDWVANRDAVLAMLAEDVHLEKGNRIFMVPELISHDVERRLCAIAGDTASRYAEVLSFSRLVRRVSEYTGVTPPECLDNGGRVIAMASVAKQLRANLKAYAAVETKPEFLTALLDAVDEFKRCCITPADLRRASNESEGVFAQKLEELSLLYEGYDALTARGKCDPRDQMTWLLEQLEMCDFAQEHIFYIEGFPDFTRQHMAILAHLIAHSPLVVVSINCDRIGSDAMAFQKGGETSKTLQMIAKRSSVEVDVRVLPPEATPLTYVWDKLYEGEISEQFPFAVTTLHTNSANKEVRLAADRIMELLASGTRYRDISIVCGNVAPYRSAFNTIFRNCGISYYLSGKDPVLERPAMRTVLCALDVVLGGFAQDDVLSYLRSAMSPLSLGQCDVVENYVLLWGISGNAWCEKWTMHPRGLDAKWTEGSQLELEKLESLRSKIITPLLNLRVGFQKSRKISEKVVALYDFLEEIEYPRRLRLASEKYDGEGNNREAQVLDQLWSILLNALEQLYDVLGETNWENAGFSRLFRLLLSQYDVGTIPPVLDAVTIGPASAMRCQQTKHLIVLGMLEGDMPGYSGSVGILNDWERTTLRQLGVPLTGGALDGLQAELAEIYGVFCGARESVTASYHGGMPSFVFRRLSAVSGVEKCPTVDEQLLGTDSVGVAAGLLSTDNGAIAGDIGLTEKIQMLNSARNYEHGSVTEENIHKLYGDTLLLSASQVDKFAECRMRHFLQYGLHAEERKPATVDPAQYGTFVHAVLEDTAKEVMERGGFHSCSVTETLSIARKYAQVYINEHFSDITSQRVSYLLNRNVKELEMVVEELWNELHISGFQPVDFEVYFGEGGKMPPIYINGAHMQGQLRGYVDRVDVWRDQERKYFRVVDYKTGKKDFDYCDIYNGIGLQMLLYLFALSNGGAEVLGDATCPAGVQYFPARAPVVATDGALTTEEAEAVRIREWKRKGLILHDTDVIQAMQPAESPKRLDVSVKKDGTMSGGIASREQFGDLEKYLGEFLRQMVNTISSGEISANPYMRGSYHNACAYCPYGQICHSSQVENRREYAAMSAGEFWDYVGKKVGSNGNVN